MGSKIGDPAPDFEAHTTEGRDRLPRVDRRRLGRALLAPRIHPGVRHELGYIASIKPDFDSAA